MGLVLPTIEAYQVQHLPIVKAYADKIGLVEAINQLVPTEMAIDPGTIVLGMIIDTLSGRSPLYRLEEFFTHQDTALLLGKAVPPEVFQDDTVGRVLERLYATGTMKVFTACAVRADRDGHLRSSGGLVPGAPDPIRYRLHPGRRGLAHASARLMARLPRA